MDNTILKRSFAALGLLLFLAVLVLVPVVLYADSLYRDVFGAQTQHAESDAAFVTAFDLQAEETAHQAGSRMSAWLGTVASREVSVSTARGKLGATQYEPVLVGESAPWAIVFHGGLGTDRSQVTDIACMLSIQGFRVLTPDLYAHGKSEGDAATLGFGDAKDVQAWIDYAMKTQQGARIVLFGVDEGAAAVLSAACEGFANGVAAVAADSACDDGAARMLRLAGVEDGGLQAALLRQVFKRKTSSDSAKLSEKISAAKMPLLLIHGTGDQTVPAWNSEDIALAAGENAQLLFVEGAGHGKARFLDEQQYYETLLSFYEQALK